MQTRSRKIVRDVGARRGRTLMASLSIFIGVLGVVILVSTADLLTRKLNETIKPADLPMLYDYVTVGGSDTVDNDAVFERLRQVPAVDVIEGRTVNPITWKRPGDEEFNTSFLNGPLEPFDAMILQPVQLAEGAYPEAGQQQIAVEKRMAERYDLAVGDPLTLRILGGDSDTPAEEDWTISGIIFQAYPNLNLGTGSGAGFIPPDNSMFAAFDDAQYITNFTGLNQIFVRFTDFGAAISNTEVFLETLSAETPYVTIFTLSDNPDNSIVTRTVNRLTTVLIVLGILAMVVSGFLVTNIISTVMLEQKRQVGVMKSLGATRVDNLQIYIGVALVYGVIGMLPGVILGAPMGFFMAQAVASRANILIDTFELSVLGIVLGLMMGMLIPLLASIGPIINGTRISILEAMTDLGISSSYGKGPLAQSISILPFPLNIRQSLSNVTRKKGRLTLTIVTLTTAIAAFMGVFAMVYAINAFINDSFSSYDYQIQLAPNNPDEFAFIREVALADVPAIAGVYPGINVDTTVAEYTNPANGSKGLFVRGFDVQAEAFDLPLVAGEGWRNDPEREGIAIPTAITQQSDIRLGDTVNVTIGANVASLEVIAIFETSSRNPVMRWDQLASLAGSTAGAPVPNQYITQVAVEGYDAPESGDGTVTALGVEVPEMALSLVPAAAELTADPPKVIITKEMAERSGLGAGDTITLSALDGSETRTYEIAEALDRGPLLMFVPDDVELPEDGIGIYWQELAALEGRSLEGKPVPNQVYFQLAGDQQHSIADVDEVIKDLSEALSAAGITGRYTNSVEQANQTAQLALSLGLVFGLTALVMAAVGAVGLLATLSMSVIERQKEIGVMRSIGASSRTIITQFWVEGLVIALVSWLIAIPLSIILSQALHNTIQSLGLGEFQYPFITVIIGVVGTVAIATIASLGPSMNAARKTVSEIIRYQ